MFASGNQRYPNVKQNFTLARKHFNIARDESGLSSRVEDKLPAGVWERILNDPLQARTLIDTYEEAIAGIWRGSIGVLDPSRTQKLRNIPNQKKPNSSF